MVPVPPASLDLTALLRSYAGAERGRATGGLYALSGFDFQLRAALSDFVALLAARGAPLEKGGGVFVEALSDHVRCEADRLVCVQAKRTLTKATLRHAAEEIAAIDGFLASRGVPYRESVRFEVVASSIDPAGLDWPAVFDDEKHGDLLRALHAAGRLLPPRRVEDPWWRVIATVFHLLADPFDFARFALERLVARQVDPADAARARDDIAERFARARRPDAVSTVGQVLRPEDFAPNAAASGQIAVGRAPTLELLRDGQYMPRAASIAWARDALERVVDASRLRGPNLSRVDVFWIHGRSGAGKSVLVLQLLEAMVREGRSCVWLGGNVEGLEPLLRACRAVDEGQRPEFVFVDDLYTPDARERLDLARLGRFIEESATTAWPVIVTCGPPEFVEAFRDAARSRGFALREWMLPLVGNSEADALATWFQRRTGRQVVRGEAFAQARRNNGLLTSIAFEAAGGDLEQFAARFRARFQAMDGASTSDGPGLAEQVQLSLALGRLYLGAPYGWLTSKARERLEALNRDGDFAVFDTGGGPQRRYLRLTHPHISDALYRALRRPATPLAYANDLGDAFTRALSEGDFAMSARLLRLFAAEAREGVVQQRLAEVDLPALVERCLEAWTQHRSARMDEHLAADIAVSWAGWASHQPRISEVLGRDLVVRAVRAMDGSMAGWAELWQRLWNRYPSHPELVRWSAEALPKPERMVHAQWSFAWETLLVAHPEGLDLEAWAAVGESWLASHGVAPDWHFVWRHLIPPADREASPRERRAIELGLRRLETSPDRADWAHVLQDLLLRPKATGGLASAEELVDRAWRWLAGREERPEWAYVWRDVLKRPAQLPAGVTEGSAVAVGWRWLAGREERAEWAHVWEAVLERSAQLPAGVTEESVVEVGWKWLAGRGERAEWSYVWREVLKRPAQLPAGVKEANVVEVGWRWLSGREERADWAHVWETVLKRPTQLPAGVKQANVVEVGWKWLAGREERADWSYVWREVLKRHAQLPAGVKEASVVEVGWKWLAGREDRPEWAHVWEVMLERPAQLPAGVSEATVVEVGWQWLVGRETRPDWSFVWEDILARSTDLPAGVTKAMVVERGLRWLVQCGGAEDWALVWTAIARSPGGLNAADRARHLASGFSWLADPRNKDSKSFGHVLERLFDLGAGEPAASAGATWLDEKSLHPSWPVIAAKAIVVARAMPAAERWGEMLVRKIQRDPFRKSYEHVEAVLSTAMKRDIRSPTLDRLRETLRARRRDTDAQLNVLAEYVTSGASIEAQVTNTAQRPLMVLVHGVRAILSLDERVRVREGDLIQVVVTRVHRERRHVWVRPMDASQEDAKTARRQLRRKPDETVAVGRVEDGVIENITAYGLFVEFRGFIGLLHRSRLPAGMDPLRSYQRGDAIQVRVSSIDSKGIQLSQAE